MDGAGGTGIEGHSMPPGSGAPDSGKIDVGLRGEIQSEKCDNDKPVSRPAVLSTMPPIRVRALLKLSDNWE